MAVKGRELLGRLVCLLIIALLPLAAKGATFPNETLHYVITYKWGLIHKEAATAVLSLKSSGNNYNLTLTAKTKPWADKVFRVRDTLTSVAGQSDLMPLRYVKTSHEGGKYGRDEIDFSYSGKNVTGKATRHRIDKKGNKTENHISLQSTGPTYDMLSVFYYLRTLNYNELSKGKTAVATIFSGKKAEKLTIRCLGKERIVMRDNSHKEAWHIKFRFTSNGGKKSSDDIDAWISTGQEHVPLQVFGNLPLGQVRVYLTSKL